MKTNTHQSQSLLSSFTLFIIAYVGIICRHFDINSDLLFNMFTSSRFLIITVFSPRHKLQLLITVKHQLCIQLLITKLMNTNITMISQILHWKNVMKIIKRLLDIWPLQIFLSITGNLLTMAVCLQSTF